MRFVVCGLFGIWYLVLGISSAYALGEINISEVSAREKEPLRFELQANITNTTQETREVILRAQIEIFDRMVPRGEQPLSVFRKDQSLILKSGETRPLRVEFVGEGLPPKGVTRIEPALRIRRQRVWNY
ncbi:MAG: hypothetical protein EXS63_03950 [Candidatus Omnitrophica bacterium]|nr:hypothetical protein [Candidatus Omnitrophota bacterium]